MYVYIKPQNIYVCGSAVFYTLPRRSMKQQIKTLSTCSANKQYTYMYIYIFSF